MVDYESQIENLENPVFSDFIRIAYRTLSVEKRHCPWKGLNHGVDLLHTDELLSQYLWSYGKMHEKKIRIALNALPTSFKYYVHDVTIVDWGCGQGLASCCCLDYFRENGISFKNVKRIILIEPSYKALGRAKIHLQSYLKSDERLLCVNKFIDDLKVDDLALEQGMTLHFFSNILDINSVNIAALSLLINDVIKGKNYFFCVGPANLGSTRIDSFAKYMGIDDESIIRRASGRLSGRGTIKMLVFTKEQLNIEIIKKEYYIKPKNMINERAIKRLIKLVQSNIKDNVSVIDKILLFYKMVLELERSKEPQIQNVYEYEWGNKNENTFLLDLSQNQQFVGFYEDNLNPAKTKWPANLYVGLRISLNDQKYRLFNNIINISDLKDFDIQKNLLPISFADFTVNIQEADKLELIAEDIEKLAACISSTEPLPSFDGLQEIIKQIISRDAVLEKIACVALSQKNPAISQTYSEMSNWNLNRIANKNSFLQDFLLRVPIMNQLDGELIDKEEILHITSLDRYQEDAVVYALNNKLSVITGPPGTGKTQVILNILANAAVLGKKVLVASKNNKAVDNVKDRFDAITGSNAFLMRFGHKEYIKKTTIPTLNDFVRRPPMEPDANAYSEYLEKKRLLKEIKNEYNEQLEAKKYYEKERDNCYYELDKVNKDIDKLRIWAESVIEELQKSNQDIWPFLIKPRIWSESELEDLHEANQFIWSFVIECKEKDVDACCMSMQLLRNKLYHKFTDYRKFWNFLFNKKKSIMALLQETASSPYAIRNYFSTLSLKQNIEDFRSVRDLLAQSDKVLNVLLQANKLLIDITRIKNETESKNLFLLQHKKSVQKKIDDCDMSLNSLTKKLEQLEIDKNDCINYIKQNSVRILYDCLLINQTQKDAVQKVNKYKDFIPDSIPINQKGLEEFVQVAREFLDVFKLNAVTSLSIKSAFPIAEDLFDMVIIDEASQCDIASAIPLVARAKQIVVIGDPLQLKHITPVIPEEESIIAEQLNLNECNNLKYVEESLWDYCSGFISNAFDVNKPVMLTGHYRCHPRIIGYSNDFFYRKRLGRNLEINTVADGADGIYWVNVQGEQKDSTININEKEVVQTLELAKKIYDKDRCSIGIITPFRAQAAEINKMIPNELRSMVTADTVHAFQGDERDVIIISLVVTDNSPINKIRWIDEACPNIMNVAVTRARQALYIVGNKSYILNNSNHDKSLGFLARYV